jgi:uncharacterized protein with HEPN domain
MTRRDREWLSDILEAIAHVERYTAPGRDAFDQNELIRVWTIYHIQVIGEAAAHLSEEVTERYIEIPWPQIVAMRNILVHAYFSIVDDQVWNTVEKDLPTLKGQIEAILSDLNQ